ncbi:ATP-binding cassette domain-containing protein [Lactobacillus delbrueckii]|uniref:ATP-binding cassette domain-containing protein n=1 Tax=Lactobacillus delbrueckii TaxID=1584 RepID=UPI0038518DFE
MDLLKIEGLSVKYSEKTILSKISFSFLPGNFYLIKGPSGIGKTSLINCLGLLKKPSSGSVFWGEKNLWELSDNDRADFRHSYISFVFQKNNLVENMSVKNNILLPLATSSDYNSDHAIKNYLKLRDCSRLKTC